ncbi:ABC transporter ATP-binding protein [Verminephrobacter eiseniae]|uniref:ABC transporter ATP-binding protein n=1 Tax=Verminephrobacter eiseniae TaxID=364317 RepID=UPI0022382527|nr:ABC transporter ATP-binding protein [Verminephrobacter eiseniae]MCW5233247.1 ABC transporter ATP-binding protein [Verminephrobacter eiseniae]MCW5295199.1 ABC transporter ATP-binding protein [Verminephrobacter eiseniae]MCW8184149.1 ABC transporter ATP-binding protein [Verminephrobacter eiseniae]MCW8222678.1 ABC transporter ATP-binding protein [Verminephrobacter eiseniae]MCW8234148.1 ABC transporter ATP-binding protein [Verminephrobacter eiseniae]
MNLLSVRNLVKRYGGLLATDHFNMSVETGETHAVIGPNGAGKSTLIAQLSGESRPSEGSILFDGKDITQVPVYRRARMGLARSYQITSVFNEFSALQNVMLAAQAQLGHSFRFWSPMMRSRSLRESAESSLDLVGLGSRIDVCVADMAHGEHRQLELAMALVSNPRLLLLDEPMAGMSQGESEQMAALLAKLKGSCTMVLVEHDMNAVFALADRITVLVYGKSIACGSVGSIRSSAQVRAAYLGDDDD